MNKLITVYSKKMSFYIQQDSNFDALQDMLDNFVLEDDFQGPTGPTGIHITGPTGADGLSITGPTGATGLSVTGPTGATGISVTGPTGAGMIDNYTLTLTASFAVSSGDVVQSTNNETITPFGHPVSSGTQTLFQSGGASSMFCSAAYDSTNDRIVIAYRNLESSNHGYAVVGTVNASTNSITFGTPVILQAGGTDTGYISTCYDSTNDRIVIGYSADYATNNDGYAVVGAVSGTTITFGTPVPLEATPVASGDISCVYDSTSDRVVISYANFDSSVHGYTVVGDVDPGTNSITFGTPVALNTAAGTSQITSSYDSTNDRVVIAYKDGAIGYGYGIVGDVNPGTNSIAFGTRVSLTSPNSIILYTSSAYDSTNDRVVVVYSNSGSSGHGYAVVGDVDPGTNAITFGTPVLMQSPGTSTEYTATTYNPSTNKIVVVYANASSSNHGTMVIGTVNTVDDSITFTLPVTTQSPAAGSTYNTVAYDSTNDRIVSAKRNQGGAGGSDGFAIVHDTGVAYNVLGIAQAGIAAAASGSILISGISSIQSGLATGTSYYASTGTYGALSSTVNTYRVGTAISATGILIDR